MLTIRTLISALVLAASILSAGTASAATLSETELALEKLGLVEVTSIDPSLQVDLKYARPDNFMGEAVYGDLTHCFLRPEAASMLRRANELLKERHPSLRLLLVDGLRPNHIQRRMWKLVKDTPMRPYVAEPGRGSNHNFGCAVDITIMDLSTGRRLDMGTPVDHFGELAEPRQEARFLKEGRLTQEQVANRKILRQVMTQAGFKPLAIEWWHFDAFDKSAIRQRYTIVE